MFTHLTSRRTSVVLVALALAATAPVLAQAGSLDPFVQHPQGHSTTVPCTHMVQQHPNGHPTTVPCVHPPVQAHPNGHAGPTAPCAHMVQAHSNGHTVHGVKVACAHMVQQHPNGHPTTVPCAHLVVPHPDGHPGPTAPCTHMIVQHPNGHAGPTVPCTHAMAIVRSVNEFGIDFFTNDRNIQATVLDAARRFRDQGIVIGSPRRLSVFSRAAAGNGGGGDPFWSHYSSRKHYIQILPAHARNEDVIRHELGHALLGNQCIRITSPGGQHTMMGNADPALAMSEGWAHFVSLMLGNQRNAATANHNGFEFESAHTNTGASFTQRSEFRVGAVLWDVFDSRAENGDAASLGFQQMFRVYSPSLQTLTRGPMIGSLDDYLERLALENRGQARAIEAARALNMTAPTARRPRRPRGR